MIASLALALLITTRARAVQPGELIVLTITAPARTDAVRVHAFGRDISGFRDDDQIWQALVGIDLETRAGAYAVDVESLAQGVVIDRGSTKLQVLTRHFPTRQLHVDEAFVNPPAHVQDRIAREAQELDAIWKATSSGRLWTGAFVRPVPGAANSQFGTRSIFNGVARNPHGGGDFLSPAGTPVKAPNAGLVVLADDLYFSGNTVVIDHGLGLFSMLAHLSSIDVHKGDHVRAGDVVGKVGATGRVTGPHLHWAVRASWARVDPLSLLALLGPQR